MGYCELCDLPEETCYHGRGLVDPEEPVTSNRVLVGHPFRAKFDGRCGQPGCRNEVNEGDLIRYVEDRIACGRCS